MENSEDHVELTFIKFMLVLMYAIACPCSAWRERSGSVVECLTRDRRHCVVSLSKNISPSLVLVQPRKTRPFITERLLMGRKESNQTKCSAWQG